MTDGAEAWEAGRPLRWIAVAVIAGAWALALRLWRATWRADTTEAARLDALLGAGERVVAVFWHGNYLPLFPLVAGRRALVVTSRSFRGAVIAGISRSFGFRTRQVGDAPHSTGRALRDELARPGGMVAIAVDGPLGPRHVVKPGAVVLAAHAGAQLVPVRANAAGVYRVKGRWDWMELPLPGTRIVLRVGAPLPVAPGDATHPEPLAAAVRAALETLGEDRPADLPAQSGSVR